MKTILSLDHLSKNFNGLQAVNQVSFEIEKGNVYGILGPNGSGKSTTLGIVLNVVNKTSGEFSWFNGSLSTHDALKKVGAIIERPNFYPYMTAKQNLELVCRIKEVPFDKIAEKLELVGLLDRQNSKFSGFSLGMKQRLAIASALLNNPEVLILDEPTNGLDPQGIHQIREIIRSIAEKGITILLASHLLDEVEKVCSHVIILHRGRFLYAGPVSEMHGENGFFILQSSDMNRLQAVLQNHPDINQITMENGHLNVTVKKPVDASDLNRYLFENGIILSHLVFRNETLEERFLKITNSQN